jgi:hypothetical protein
MVVGKYSSSINDEIGRVPIWKNNYYMTHKILLEKERKERKIVGRG